MIWRPILSKHCSLEEVKKGVYTLTDLLKINALLQMQDDIRLANQPKPKKGG